MSIAALNWAFGLDIKPSSLKFLLVAIADNADNDGNAYPSLDALVAKTSQDRKTVIQGISRLEAAGILVDTGRRVGRTGQVKVYQLAGCDTGNRHYTYRITDTETGEFYVGVRSCFGEPERDSQYMGSGGWPLEARKSRRPLHKEVLRQFASRRDALLGEAELIQLVIDDPLNRNRTVPKTEPLKSTENGIVATANSTVFPSKQYRFSVERVPKTVPVTIIEPKKEPRPRDARACEAAGLDFETAIQSQYPAGSGVTPSAWGVGLRHACRLVEQGVATEAELLDAVGRYRASIESRVAIEGERARQYVKSPARFFDPTNNPPIWRDEFPIAVTRAQAAQDDNVAAGIAWLNGAA